MIFRSLPPKSGRLSGPYHDRDLALASARREPGWHVHDVETPRGMRYYLCTTADRCERRAANAAAKARVDGGA